MRRNPSPIPQCLVLVLLLSVLSSSGWAVVCIGDDGHRAIELVHPRGGCERAVEGRAGGVAEGGLAASEGACFDVPLSGLGVPATRPLHSFDSWAPVAILVTDVSDGVPDLLLRRDRTVLEVGTLDAAPLRHQLRGVILLS